MSTIRRADWGNVTLREYDALNTIRRTPADILTASIRYRDSYVGAIVSSDPIPPAGSPFFSPAGEEWVRDIHARYMTAWQAGDEPGEITLAREYLREVGTMATMGIHRHLSD